MTAASALRAVPLFAQLRESDLELLARLLKQRDYTKNRVILFAHDPCDAFYVVIAGQVKVMLIAEDGREVVLALMRHGDFFGEMALMDDEPYAATVIAMEDSSLLVLQRDDLRRCIADMPGVAFGLLRALCSRLREADHKIGELMLLDVAGRVSHLFLELAARRDGQHIPDPPTHQVIAQMVGSSRETVSRTISSLASRNLIETSQNGIKILNRSALEAAAGQLLKRRLRTAPVDGQERRRSPGPSPAIVVKGDPG
ncbi:MAG TPA: Crp/Fnr family transcriptional regulator [Gemmatimonadaceae bacterium]|nr:Crp/Fnr family transcriptional regulator [Gemmatimonadaceae bacterium]